MSPGLESCEGRLSASTWSGVIGGLWSVAGNWDVPPAAGSDLTFSAGGANKSNTNDLAAGLSIGSLTIAGDGYAIAGNALVVQGSIAATYASGSSSVTLPIQIDDATTVTVDDADATLQLGGVISGDGGLTKQGAGQLTLSAANTYQGPTAVASGTLIVNGSQPSSAVTIASGATLGGTGVVGSIASTGGTLRAGDSAPGRLTATGGLTLDASSTFTVALNGTAAGQDYSQVRASGTVALGGADLDVTLGFAPTGNPSFTIIDNTGSAPVSGTFAGLDEGATFTVSTETLRISYAGGDGNDVVLTRLIGSSTTLQASTTTPVFGQGVTLTATVAADEAGEGEPSGTVEFFRGNTSLGTATLSGGVATLATSTLPVGAGNLTVRYLGDADFAASESDPVSVQVAQASTATTLVVDPTSSVSGQSVSLTATVAAVGPGSGVPTGTVEFFHGTTSLGTATLSGGVAALSTTALPIGDGSISAHYLGDGNFVASNSDGTPVDVTQASTTTTVDADPNPVGLGQSVTLTATVAVVTPGSGTPTGTVEFFNGSTSLGTADLVDGVATLSTSALPLGANTISAHYEGDEDFVASTSPDLTVNVLPATNTTVASNPTSSVFGQEVTLTATVAPGVEDDETPTGTVEFFVGTTSLGTATLTDGVAVLHTTALPAGAGSVTAKYLGDSNFAGSTSSSITVQVAQASTATTLATSPGSPVFGQSVTLTATVAAVSPGAGTPTGTVEFFNGSTSLGTATITNGVATLSTSALPVGTSSITAKFTGSGNFTASTSSASSVTVAQATTNTALTTSTSSSTFGQSVTLTATVGSVAPGAGTPTGTVEFFSGTTSLGTATLTNGVATLTTGAVPVGTNTITAKFQGGTNFASSTSTGASLSVAQASTTTTVTTTPNPSNAGQSVTLTATVAAVGPGAGTATGTVEFFAGTTSLGTATLTNGVATLSTTAIPAGSNAITAQYRGDANFKTSTSTAVTQQVNLATTNTTVTSSSTSPGAFTSVTLTATVAASATGVATPTGTVEFFANGISLGTATLSGGKATLTLDSLPVGVDAITAKYQGDSSSATSTSSALTVVVGTANEIYVNQLYLSLLGREAEQQGLEFWSNLLDSGHSRLSVVSAIARTPAAQANLVQSVFQTYLGREASDAEVSQTINAAIRSSVNVQAVVLSSREYFNTVGGGTVSGYLDALSNDVFGTTFPAPVQADLASRLQRGTPPLEVVTTVLTSRAGKSALIQSSFESILGRSPSSSELAHYNTLAAQGVYLRQINDMLFASQEFFDLATSGSDSSSSEA